MLRFYTFMIISYSEIYKNDIIQLADKAFGIDFINHDFIHQNAENIHICTNNNHELTGFTIEEKFPLSDFKQTFRLNFPDYGIKDIKILKTIAVDNKYRKKGFGKKLIKSFIDRNRNNFLASPVWLYPQQNLNIILDKFGFEPVKFLPNYWYDDSIKKQYKCKICNHPPCCCAAILFLKTP
ncbi:MAG: hypothetical protein Kow0079_04870 [Vicingaceae bacterium]